MTPNPDQMVFIDYTNHRSERRPRLLVPHRIEFVFTDFHPQSQWILVGHDLEKDALRSYAMSSVHAWGPHSQGGLMTDDRRALLACRQLFKEVLPNFNWGASVLDAHDITLLNTVPALVEKALGVSEERG